MTTIWTRPRKEVIASSSMDFPATNIISNSDLSSGTTGWATFQTNSILSVIDGNLRATKNDVNAYVGNIFTDSIPVGSKVFLGLSLRGNKVGNVNIALANSTLFGVIEQTVTYDITVNTEFAKMEFIYPVQSATVVGFRIRGDDFTADGDWLEIAPYVIAVNLTETFGDGVEPTTEDFKTILSKYPNSWFNGTINPLLDFKEVYKDYNSKILDIQQNYEHKFVAEYTTVKLERELTDTSNNNLSLISKKTVQEGTFPPDTIGYLYLDETAQKVYYSSGGYDKPQFLFDWNLTLSNNIQCQYYNAHITNDGDIIFLRNRHRENPIIYPAGDYDNPVLVDFGVNIKPYGWETDSGIEQHPVGDYFVYGEYASHSLDGESSNDRRNIWKVTKPYANLSNWQIKHSFKHVYFTSPESDEPNNEIGHIHTVVRDFYTGAWYCSTGDIDRHCRVWQSLDEGETWAEAAVNGQKWRAFGMIFTKNAAYWGADSHGLTNHALFRVNRNQDTGILDFSTITKLAIIDQTAGQPQPTYTTCYLRNPHGLLFLDRAEPRTDNLLDLTFWSFDDEKLYVVDTLNRIPDEENNNRHGFGNQVATKYQPTTENGIICGSGSYIRRNKVDLLNNSINNRVGNIKIRLYEV